MTISAASQLRFEQPLEPLIATAADREPGSAFQNGDTVAFKEWMKFFDSIEIDDSGAVDAEKLVRIKAFFQFAHASAQEMCLAADVQIQIVTHGLDPIDLARLDEQNPSASFDGHPGN